MHDKSINRLFVLVGVLLITLAALMAFAVKSNASENPPAPKADYDVYRLVGPQSECIYRCPVISVAPLERPNTTAVFWYVYLVDGQEWIVTRTCKTETMRNCYRQGTEADPREYVDLRGVKHPVRKPF